MPSRFYLPSSGSGAVAVAAAADWERAIAAAAVRPLVRTKSNTALTDVAALMGSTATSQTRWMSFVSEPLVGDQSISGTISMVVRGLEAGATEDAHLAFIFKVTQGDSTTLVRGTPTIFHATSTEFATSAATRIHSARALTATISALSGDRIVIELGIHAVTAANTANITLRFGDPSGTADFALTEGLTTDLCPWVELSSTLVFDAPTNAAVTAVAAVSTRTAAVPTALALQQGAVTAVAAVSTLTAAAPTVVAVQQGVITAVAAVSTLTAAPPTVEIGAPATNADITAVAATSTQTATAPTVVAVQQGAVVAVAAVATTTAPVPTVAAQQQGVITTVAAVTTTTAAAPTVVGLASAAITAVAAELLWTAGVPSVSAGEGAQAASVTAVAATLTRTAAVPAVVAVQAASVTVGAAEVLWTAAVPSVSAVAAVPEGTVSGGSALTGGVRGGTALVGTVAGGDALVEELLATVGP